MAGNFFEAGFFLREHEIINRRDICSLCLICHPFSVRQLSLFNKPQRLIHQAIIQKQPISYSLAGEQAMLPKYACAVLPSALIQEFHELRSR
jgi:hypothetical protein